MIIPKMYWIIPRHHLAVSGLTVRPLVWPWQQVCVGSVRNGGVWKTWLFIMTSPVYWLQCGRSHSGQLVWVVWVGRREGSHVLIVHMCDIKEPGRNRQLDRWRCSAQNTPLVKVSCKSVYYFVSNPADRQTNEPTRLGRKHNPLGGDNMRPKAAIIPRPTSDRNTQKPHLSCCWVVASECGSLISTTLAFSLPEQKSTWPETS